jgi:hypothetical protein
VVYEGIPHRTNPYQVEVITAKKHALLLLLLLLLLLQ